MDLTNEVAILVISIWAIGMSFKTMSGDGSVSPFMTFSLWANIFLMYVSTRIDRGSGVR